LAQTGPGTTLIDVTGSLERGDEKLDGGEYYDAYTFEATAGDILKAELRSASFDTWVGLRSPSGEVNAEDDHQGRTDYSMVQITADASGTWVLVVTSSAKKEKGDYSAVVTKWAGDGGGAAPAATTSSSGGSSVLVQEKGKLASGDRTLEAGEYADVFTFQATAGMALVADVQSTSFDTFVGLISPSGESWQNDDHDNLKTQSRLEVTADASGEWTLVVTSYKGGETGPYEASVTSGSGGGAVAAPAPKPPPSTTSSSSGRAVDVSGTLAAGDDALESGEYFDVYSFSASSGQVITAEVNSSSFDTYVGLRAPSGEVFSNDDHEGRKDRSRLVTQAGESGDWLLVVTSYQGGETGSYSAWVELSGGGGVSSSSGGLSTETVSLGGSVEEGFEMWQGSLTKDDPTTNEGTHIDLLEIEGQAGERVTVLLSTIFADPFMLMTAPDETIYTAEPLAEGLAIEASLGQTGTYMIAIASLSDGKGEWLLTVLRDRSGSSKDKPGAEEAGSGKLGGGK